MCLSVGSAAVVCGIATESTERTEFEDVVGGGPQLLEKVYERNDIEDGFQLLLVFSNLFLGALRVLRGERWSTRHRTCDTQYQ